MQQAYCAGRKMRRRAGSARKKRSHAPSTSLTSGSPDPIGLTLAGSFFRSGVSRYPSSRTASTGSRPADAATMKRRSIAATRWAMPSSPPETDWSTSKASPRQPDKPGPTQRDSERRSWRAGQLERNASNSARPPAAAGPTGRMAARAADLSASQPPTSTIRASSCSAVAAESSAIPREVASAIPAPGRPACTSRQKELDFALLSSSLRTCAAPERSAGSTAPKRRKLRRSSPNLP